MPPSISRPTSEELEELSEAFQRDPGGEAASRLALAYLALGRPRDAIEIGAKALKFKPENLEARAIVGEAFASLHQWDRAKDELLKVVKVDRSQRRAVMLLGEVLLRRGDVHRALPVLQHAHNLDPADADIYELLKCARAGEPPPPPPPIPAPVAPAPSRPPGRAVFADEPTRQVSGEALARMNVEQVAVAPEPAPVDRPVGADPRASDIGGGRGVEHHRPPPPESPLAPLGGEGSAPHAAPGTPAPPVNATLFGTPPVPRPGSGAKEGPGSQPAAPAAPPGAASGQAPPAEPAKPKSKPAPPPSDPTARPRVFTADKPVDAAQGALKQAAVVGEHYLNQLLTSGLLHVPNVRAPDVALRIEPAKPWRRSWRIFAYLFVLLGIGSAATAGWYYYTAQQRMADLDRHLVEAAERLPSGSYADVRAAIEETERAMERVPESAEAMAAFAEAGGIGALLYRMVSPDDVRLAADRAARDIEPGTPAFRSILVGRAAVTVASLDTLDDATARLAETREELESWLNESGDDPVARWLLGQVDAAAGRRAAAREAFELAYAEGEGAPIAAVSLADLALDDGDFERAEELYGALLDGDVEGDGEEEERHELALVGAVLAGAERSDADPFEEANDAFDLLNVHLPSDRGTRLEAYKQAAEAAARLLIQDFDRMREAVDASLALEVHEPRLLARLGLLRVAEGDIEGATELRTAIRWYGEDPDRDPLVSVLDAELLLAQGRPARALAELEGRTDLRALRVRGRAHFEQGDYDRAAAELEQALAIAAADAEAEVWAAAAAIAGGTQAQREEANSELRSIARGSRSRGVHYARGAAQLAAGDTREAVRSLERSLDRVSSESPNPVAYKAHAALARLALDDGDTASAIEHLREALDHNASYLPAHGLIGTLLVEAGDAEAALEHLAAVVEGGVATAEAELAYALALHRAGEGDEREEAAEALRRAADKGADREALAEVAAELGDDGLADDL